jgi:cytochrome c-type biogenesis protein CcmH/NrfF
MPSPSRARRPTVSEQRVSRRQAFGLLAGFAALGWTRRALTPGDSPALQGQGGQQGQAAPPLPDSTLGRLMDPAAGGMESPITRYENDPFVVGIEEKLRCTCGCNLSVYTCRTTDFTCTVSPKMHQHVVELVKQGKTAQQVIDAFVAQYGVAVLMAPPPRGFNLLGYLLPGSLLLIVGTALTWILVRRNRVVGGSGNQADVPLVAVGAPDADHPSTRPSDHPSALPPDDAARLRAELEKLES